MTSWTVIAFAVLVAFAAGNYSGYHYARAEVWWTKKKMGWSHVGGLVKKGATVMGVLFVLSIVGLKWVGLL